MIIFFFLGLIIMASADSIGDISSISYLNLVCNVVGGIMMGGSAFFYFKEESRKKSELRQLVEKLAGKEEHENEISALKAIEKVLQVHSATLLSIDEKQERIIAGVCDNSEIRDTILEISESVEERLKSLEKSFINQNSQSMETITEKISGLLECVEGLTDNLSTNAQELLNAIENAEKTIKDENCKLYNAMDTLHIDYAEFRRQNESDFEKIYELQVEQQKILKTEIVEILKSIDHRIEEVNLLPAEISESVESLILKFGNTVDDIQKGYKNLVEDIEDQEKARTKKFNSIMSEIRDTSEDTNEGLAEEIKKLADQYISFEKVISTIVDQMSHMAEEDIKVMKGFLNG